MMFRLIEITGAFVPEREATARANVTGRLLRLFEIFIGRADQFIVFILGPDFHAAEKRQRSLEGVTTTRWISHGLQSMRENSM